jgi:hypothetical protein
MGLLARARAMEVTSPEQLKQVVVPIEAKGQTPQAYISSLRPNEPVFLKQVGINPFLHPSSH